MSRRKLNRRQAWRVEKIQSLRAERAKRKEERIDQELEGGALGPEQQGLVIAHFGRQLDIESLDPEHAGQITRCHMRTHLQLVTGDRVIWRASKDSGVVVASEPRHSELKRPNNQGELKTVAANIDAIMIVIAVEPHAHANLIDRYLVASEATGIEPVLVLNKIDLLDPERAERLDRLLALYSSLGYPVLRVSNQLDQGMDELAQYLSGKTTIFVGQSGVGKSSLVNQLLPEASLRVGALSEAHNTGRHTTTTARLMHLPSGGQLIDSPGIREFGLWHISEHQLFDGFREFRPLVGGCRFRDCQHESEPGCALLEAVESGSVSEQRFESFLQIRESIRASDFSAT